MNQSISLILFGEGLLTGIMLTMMLGPVTMIIVRNGIEVNRTAGVWTAAGTWVSDFIFIGLTYWMTADVNSWTSNPTTKLALYVAGGFGLMVMGVLMTRVKKKTYEQNFMPPVYKYTQAFFSGFLINSLSPFTLFFWLGSAVFLHMHEANPLVYYIGLMLTLGAGDFSKAWLAPKLAVWLKARYVYWIQVIAGIFIAVTGGYIIYLGIAG